MFDWSIWKGAQHLWMWFSMWQLCLIARRLCRWKDLPAELIISTVACDMFNRCAWRCSSSLRQKVYILHLPYGSATHDSHELRHVWSSCDAYDTNAHLVCNHQPGYFHLLLASLPHLNQVHYLSLRGHRTQSTRVPALLGLKLGSTSQRELLAGF
jgi:hypothetical protein